MSIGNIYSKPKVAPHGLSHIKHYLLMLNANMCHLHEGTNMCNAITPSY